MTFRFDKLTVKGQEAIARSQTLATQSGNPQIEPLHLLQGLVTEDDGIVAPLLEKIGANVGQLTSTVDSEIKRLPSSSAGASSASQWRPEPRPDQRDEHCRDHEG